MNKRDLTSLSNLADVYTALGMVERLAVLLEKIQFYADRTEMLKLQVRLRLEKERIDAKIQANAKSEGEPKDVPKLLQGTALPPPWIT